MHPVLSSVRSLTWYFLVWLTLGVAVASVLAWSTTTPWRNALWFAIPVCVAYAFVLPSAYYVCRAMPFARRRLGAGIALFASASAVAGSVGWGISLGWNALGQGLEQDWSGMVITPTMGLALFVVAAGLYLSSLLMHDVLIAMDQIHASQRREVQSRALAQAAELQMLRTQINPHFLFNCLNSISALTSSDPAGARSMTIALAQYFRQTLALSEQASIPLEQEVAHCHSFFAIERQRFGDKLSVQTQLQDLARTALVPPMLLQPLVENAVKHGIAQRAEAGVVVIQAQVQGSWLHLSVENPTESDRSGTHAAHAVDGLGLGLRNCQQRLLSLYGDQARLTQRVTKETFVVELTLPFTTRAQDTNL